MVLKRLLTCGLVAVAIGFCTLFTWALGQETQVNKPVNQSANTQTVEPPVEPDDEEPSGVMPQSAETPDKDQIESPTQEPNPWGDGESIFDNDMGC